PSADSGARLVENGIALKQKRGSKYIRMNINRPDEWHDHQSVAEKPVQRGIELTLRVELIQVGGFVSGESQHPALSRHLLKHARARGKPNAFDVRNDGRVGIRDLL